MGVKGLLPCLQDITTVVSLERYRGLTVAVDAMSWLHKGIYSCDVKVLAKSQRFSDNSKPRVNAVSSSSSKCIEYTISKAEILRVKFGIVVILVIDGDALPSKDDENTQRRKARDAAFEKALAAEKAYDCRTARRLYAQSCSVTHEMRYALIQRCNEVGLAFIVAPFEADAQMARLAQTGIVDLVITEDSDILVYGCPRALFKVDFTTFQGQEIQLMKNLADNITPSFRNWTHDMFVFMCIISGCDYCKGIPGIGIKLAHKIVRVHRTPPKIFNALRVANRMPPDFEEKFFIAFHTFRHQRVFCPSKQQIETLWPITSVNDYHHPSSVNKEKWSFLGGFIEPKIARGIADGTLHPKLHIPWDDALVVVFENTISATIVDDEMTSMICHHPTSTQNHRVVAANNNNNKQKSNIWYSLVYDKPADVIDTRRSNTFNDENDEQQSSAEDNLPFKRDMFSFFPKNKNRNQKEDKEDDTVDALPPVPAPHPTSKPNPSNCYVPPPHHRDVPLHFNEYASRLVGRSFNPISRKRRRLNNDGSKSAKYVQTIWDQQAASVMMQETKIDKTKADEGVRRFMKDSRTEKMSEQAREMNFFHYNEIEHYSNTLCIHDYNNNNESAHLGHAIQQYTDYDNGLSSFSKQECHLPTAETLNLDAKDFSWNKGNCIGQDDVSSHTFLHLSIFESGSYEDELPPPTRQSSYRQSDFHVHSNSSSYSEIHERDLLLELHNVYEPPGLSNNNNDTDCYITHGRYDGINYDDTECFGVDDCNPYEQLQTCKKQNIYRAFLPPLPLVRHKPNMYSSFADTEAINDNINIIESSFF